MNRTLVINSILSLQDALMDFYNDQTGEEGRHWQLLLDHFFKKKTGSQAKPKWLEKTKALLAALPEDLVIEVFRGFFLKTQEVLQSIHQNREDRELHFFNENYQELLKGMIWASALLNHPRLNDVLEHLGLLCYKKKSGHGSVSVKLGNACLSTFALLPFEDGLEKLTRFRMKITYPSVRKQIAKYINAIAEKEGKTPDELEEMVVSDFGLDRFQSIRQDLGEYRAVLKVESIQLVTLRWWKGEKELKSIPTTVRNDHAEALSFLQKQLKAIRSYLPVQRDRVEQFYLKKRRWNYLDWKKYYLDHHLMSIISHRLIWTLKKGNRKTPAIFYEGEWLDAQGKRIAVEEGKTKVQLWHPIEAKAEEVLAWRRWLENHQIQQAFKQAYREIYLVTDAELATGDYSNRFAAHILRQHQFAALCKVRQWKYKVLGHWDVQQTPELNVAHWNVRAEFWVDADWNTTTTPNGVFNHIFTDQVRFYEEEVQLDMEKVPAIVFSEVMRDVDLFVGVTSIGNDPRWQDGGNQEFDDYWHAYSFSELTESAKVRKAVLQNLVPRLKIANRCSFNGKYLVVKGDIRTYKIHIGSGNILMEPNDQYLCIVPNRKKEPSEKVFLPFEGDQMLSIIISKAFLLAADRKIKDKTILSQL
ncbi:MAG: DUF4132 domain-containing protein [Bacteroidota bacterium]